MEVGELHLGTGTTSTDFHKEGKWPSLREALNIAARGSEIIGANSFNNPSVRRVQVICEY